MAAASGQRGVGDGGPIQGKEAVVVMDEFTAPGDKWVLLDNSRIRIQALFPVHFTVLDPLEVFHQEDKNGMENPDRIWLQLKGEREFVCKAKEYVKGLCEPEMEEKEYYPKEMHCIFVGAQGLFLDRLIQDTYANVCAVEIGVLCIKGRTEPVVMAQSHVQQFIRLFKNNENLSNEQELAVKKKFKMLVEKYADKYTVDLLLLPSALKKELLSLTLDNFFLEDAYLHPDNKVLNERHDSQVNKKENSEVSKNKEGTRVAELTKQLDSVFSGVTEVQLCPINTPSSQQERLSVKRRNSEKEERCSKKPFSLESIQLDGPVTKIADTSDISIIDLISEVSDFEDSVILVEGEDNVNPETEYKILVNFFKTMGYSQDVVEKVIGDLGQSEEPLKLLEEIDKESLKVCVDHSINMSSISTGQLKARGMPSPPQCKTAVNETVNLQQQSAVSPDTQCVSYAPDMAGPSSHLPIKSDKNLLEYRVLPEKKPALAPVERQYNVHNDTVVTGIQRFQNTIKIPYKLELKNEPGRTNLKHIIIDGSNVAMSHGLKRFFSCRGIAIAVEYFWKRGHRNITVFVPQWRTKRDPNITEQHFLQQLQELGILSFTPARTVLGARIASHDDRFLLHLAEKTGGIIITNDNFREFVTESLVWREIIKERLLQYTFVGDFFMIPDDPLGRHGPNLEDFLSKQPNTRNISGICSAIDYNKGVFCPWNNSALPQMAPIFSIGQPRVFPSREARPEFTPALQNNVQPQLAIPPQRSPSETTTLKEALIKIFPESEQRQKINQILSAHPYMRDLNALSALVLD